MNRAFHGRRANRVRHVPLDVSALQLDIDMGTPSQEREDFVQSRDKWRRGAQRLEIRPANGQRHFRRDDCFVMMNDANAVRRGVNIQLDRVEPEIDRTPEGVDRIFGEDVVNAAVCNEFGQPCCLLRRCAPRESTQE